MHATSQAQFDATRAGGLPPVELVRENLWAVPVPIPGGYMSYSLLYILRDDVFGFHLIDPGWDDDENWQRVLDALTQVGARIEDVRTVTATHIHPDHSRIANPR